MCARNHHSYTHLKLALGIVREPTVWGFITSQYPGIHDNGLPTSIHRDTLLINGRLSLPARVRFRLDCASNVRPILQLPFMHNIM